MSYINILETRKSRWEEKEHKCTVCTNVIDPDTNMFQLWCEYCDTVWCNDCWKQDINGITKMAYESCGKCNKDDLNCTKAILYDLIVLENQVGPDGLKHVCDKYNLKDMFLKVKEEYDMEMEEMLFMD